MKTIVILGTLLIGLAVALVATRGTFAQTAPAAVGVSSQAEFDHDGKDTAGGTEGLKDCDLVLTPSTVADLNASGTITKQVVAPLRQGANVVPLGGLFTGVAGGSYKLWVRARDQAGNVSRWTGSAAFTLDATAPAAPANVRVTVIVTVGS